MCICVYKIICVCMPVHLYVSICARVHVFVCMCVCMWDGLGGLNFFFGSRVRFELLSCGFGSGCGLVSCVVYGLLEKI